MFCEEDVVYSRGGRPARGVCAGRAGLRPGHHRHHRRHGHDASGGALPGVTVTARNVDTGFVRTVPSSDTGAYRLEFLPIGPYVVEATLQGFKTASRSGIVLNVNDSVRVDFSLEIGARDRDGDGRGRDARSSTP